MKYLVLAFALAIGGCATADHNVRNVEDSMSNFGAPVTSLNDVSTEGHIAIRTYLNAGQRMQHHRTWLDLGIWAANLYVTTAAGLAAHPQSIFAGSMVATGLNTLDPIINAGGSAAWSRAFSRTSCIIGFVDLANTPGVQEDVSLVQLGTSTESADAWSAYQALISFSHSEVVSTYSDFLAARTPDIIAAAKPPSTPPPAPAGNVGVSGEDATGPAATRVKAIVTASTAGITQCRTNAAPAAH